MRFVEGAGRGEGVSHPFSPFHVLLYYCGHEGKEERGGVVCPPKLGCSSICG